MKPYPYRNDETRVMWKPPKRRRPLKRVKMSTFVLITLFFWLLGNASIVAPTRSNSPFSPFYWGSEIPKVSLPHNVEMPTASLIRSTVKKDRDLQKIITRILEEYPTGLPHINKARLAKFIIEQSRLYNFDPFFILSVMFAESGLDNYAVSSAGALGLMQVMPQTANLLARELAVAGVWSGKFESSQLFDPYTNVRLGIYYLHKLKKFFNYNPHQYLAAYNEGPGAIVSKLKKRRSIESPYTMKILSFYRHFTITPSLKPYVTVVY